MHIKSGKILVIENICDYCVRNTFANYIDNFYFNGADGDTEAVCLYQYSANLTYNILGAGGDKIGQVKVTYGSVSGRYYNLIDHLGV